MKSVGKSNSSPVNGTWINCLYTRMRTSGRTHMRVV